MRGGVRPLTTPHFMFFWAAELLSLGPKDGQALGGGVSNLPLASISTKVHPETNVKPLIAPLE